MPDIPNRENLEHGFEVGDMILDCHSPRVDVVDYIDSDGDPVVRLATPVEALKAHILSDPDWRAWLGKDEQRARNQLLEPVTYIHSNQHIASVANGCVTIIEQPRDF